MTIKHTPRVQPVKAADERWVDDNTGFSVERFVNGSFQLSTGGGSAVLFPSHRLAPLWNLLYAVGRDCDLLQADTEPGGLPEGTDDNDGGSPFKPGSLVENNLNLYVVLADGAQRRVLSGPYEHRLNPVTTVWAPQDTFVRKLSVRELRALGLNRDASPRGPDDEED